MMPATYEPIATTTLGASASTITFNSIPGTYTDLRLVIVGSGDGGTQVVRLNVNNDSSGSYAKTYLSGDGASVTSSNGTNQTFMSSDNFDMPASTTGQGMVTMDFFGYAGSTYKSCLWTCSGDRNGAGVVVRMVGLYRSTSAITRLDLTGGRNYAAGTTATLYGILKA